MGPGELPALGRLGVLLVLGGHPPVEGEALHAALLVLSGRSSRSPEVLPLRVLVAVPPSSEVTRSASRGARAGSAARRSRRSRAAAAPGVRRGGAGGRTTARPGCAGVCPWGRRSPVADDRPPWADVGPPMAAERQGVPAEGTPRSGAARRWGSCRAVVTGPQRAASDPSPARPGGVGRRPRRWEATRRRRAALPRTRWRPGRARRRAPSERRPHAWCR